MKKARVEYLHAIVDGEVIPESGEPAVVFCLDGFGPLKLMPHPGRHARGPTQALRNHAANTMPAENFSAGTPFQSTFHSLAGNALVDWLFMLGLLGIGTALILGIGLRIAAVTGVALVAMMWLAVYPPAQHTATGAATSSVNPLVDDHVLEALVLIVVAAFGTGSRLGLGVVWARLPFVWKHRSLI